MGMCNELEHLGAKRKIFKLKSYRKKLHQERNGKTRVHLCNIFYITILILL